MAHHSHKHVKHEHRRYMAFKLNPKRVNRRGVVDDTFTGFEKIALNKTHAEALSLYERWRQEDPEGAKRVAFTYTHNINLPTRRTFFVAAFFRYVGRLFSAKIRARQCHTSNGKVKLCYPSAEEALASPTVQCEQQAYFCKRHQAWHLGRSLIQRNKNDLSFSWLEAGIDFLHRTMISLGK